MFKEVDALQQKQEDEERKFYYQYWKHYQALENKVLYTDTYVSINEENFKTFSVEYDILLLAICSEIDVVAKRFCLEVDTASKADNIYDYIEYFNKLPQLIENKHVEKKY